jgi:PhoPQ-activated pathogenicity-related protein
MDWQHDLVTVRTPQQISQQQVLFVVKSGRASAPDNRKAG